MLFGSGNVSVKAAAKQYADTGSAKQSEKPPLFTKPATLANKVNGRELIEKQKNWISHFASAPPKKAGSPEKQSKGFAVQPKSLEVDESRSPKSSPLSSPSKGGAGDEYESWTHQPGVEPPTSFIIPPHAEDHDESLSSTSDCNESTATNSQNTIVEVQVSCATSLINTSSVGMTLGASSEPGLIRGGSSANILDDESFVDDTLSLASVSTPVGGLDVAAEEFKGSEEIEVVKEVALRTGSAEPILQEPESHPVEEVVPHELGIVQQVKAVYSNDSFLLFT